MQKHRNTDTHTYIHIQGLRGVVPGGCVFSSEENLTTMISTLAADIMNWAFQTEFCIFKVNKSEFNVMMVITSDLVDAYKK